MKVGVIVVGLYVVVGWGFGSSANAQTSIAFVPNIGFVPSGATMTVTPAVSADRRYVRLSVQPFFNSFNGFTNISIPGAVSGGGGFGGFGGLNGVVAGGGFGGAGSGMSPGASLGLIGEPLAGPVPFYDELAELGPPLGDPLTTSAAAVLNPPGPDTEGLLDQEAAIAQPASRRADDGRGVQAADQQHPRQRRTSPRKSPQRRSSTAKRRPR